MGDCHLRHRFTFRLRKVGSILLILLLASCSKESVNTEQSEQTAGATLQIMVMFAPGQLGDKGFADSVMEGLNAIEAQDDTVGVDSIDVCYMSPLDAQDALRSLDRWAGSAARLFSDGEYERRLLILTEPYMADWLKDISGSLRPMDEVLFLKSNEDDISKISGQYSLENRVHGLNISASASAVKFCKYILRWMKNEGMTAADRHEINVFRLYDKEEYRYRDDLVETLQRELGDSVVFREIAMVGLKDSAGNVMNTTQDMVEIAYDMAFYSGLYCETLGFPYVLVDLGAGNAGWDYYLMSNSWNGIYTLILDAKKASRLDRYYIYRNFGLAVNDWVHEWKQKSAGEMDIQKTHYDDRYCEDNIFPIEESDPE